MLLWDSLGRVGHGELCKSALSYLRSDSLQWSLPSASHCPSVTASCSAWATYWSQHVSPEKSSGWAERHGPLCVPPCQPSPGAGAHRRAAVAPPLSAGSFYHVGMCTPDFSSVWWGFWYLCERRWEVGIQHAGRWQVWSRALHKRDLGEEWCRVRAHVKARVKERSYWSAGSCPPHQHKIFICVVDIQLSFCGDSASDDDLHF